MDACIYILAPLTPHHIFKSFFWYVIIYYIYGTCVPTPQSMCGGGGHIGGGSQFSLFIIWNWVLEIKFRWSNFGGQEPLASEPS